MHVPPGGGGSKGAGGRPSCLASNAGAACKRAANSACRVQMQGCLAHQEKLPPASPLPALQPIHCPADSHLDSCPFSRRGPAKLQRAKLLPTSALGSV